jgi:hypothetical protein
VTLAGGRRAVIEDVAEMAAAAAAMLFGARIDQLEIGPVGDGIRQRLVKTRPAGAAVEFGLGRIERQVAGRAVKDAGALLVVERAGERPFGASLRITANCSSVRRRAIPLH